MFLVSYLYGVNYQRQSAPKIDDFIKIYFSVVKLKIVCRYRSKDFTPHLTVLRPFSYFISSL